MPWPCGCSRSDIGGSFAGWVLSQDPANISFHLIPYFWIFHVQWCSSFCGHHGLLILFQSDVYQHPSDLEERCREDPDLVLAAVSGDGGRCLALSSLQYDESFGAWGVLGRLMLLLHPMVHPWLRAAKHASPVGLSSFSLMIFCWFLCMTFWAKVLSNPKFRKWNGFPFLFGPWFFKFISHPWQVAGSLLQCRLAPVCSRAFEGAFGSWDGQNFTRLVLVSKKTLVWIYDVHWYTTLYLHIMYA